MTPHQIHTIAYTWKGNALYSCPQSFQFNVLQNSVAQYWPWKSTEHNNLLTWVKLRAWMIFAWPQANQADLTKNQTKGLIVGLPPINQFSDAVIQIIHCCCGPNGWNIRPARAKDLGNLLAAITTKSLPVCRYVGYRQGRIAQADTVLSPLSGDHRSILRWSALAVRRANAEMGGDTVSFHGTHSFPGIYKSVNFALPIYFFAFWKSLQWAE